jgi:hypothetical protein
MGGAITSSLGFMPDDIQQGVFEETAKSSLLFGFLAVPITCSLRHNNTIKLALFIESCRLHHEKGCHRL